MPLYRNGSKSIASEGGVQATVASNHMLNNQRERTPRRQMAKKYKNQPEDWFLYLVSHRRFELRTL